MDRRRRRAIPRELKPKYETALRIGALSVDWAATMRLAQDGTQLDEGQPHTHEAEKTGEKTVKRDRNTASGEIVAIMPACTSQLCFMVSRKETRYTRVSSGNLWKVFCISTGLANQTDNGLRKATLRHPAELQAANKATMALSGQDKEETLAFYTANADQIRLTNEAVTISARAEIRRNYANRTSNYRLTVDG